VSPQQACIAASRSWVLIPTLVPPAAFLLSAKNKAAPGRTLSTGAASLRPPDRLRIGPLLAHIVRKVPGVRSVPHPLKLV
jgi:hypothetical protein